MYKEDYSHLLEIQSLDLKIKTHLDRITEEEQRLVHLDELRQRRSRIIDQSQEEIQILKKDINSKENKLSVMETRLEQLTQNQAQISSTTQMEANEKELSLLSEQINSLQEEALLLMDEEENLHSELAEAKEFLKGSEQTKNEIKLDIEQVNNREQVEIQRYKERISALKNQLRGDTRDIFENVQKRYQYKNPVTFINDKSCRECRFTIDNTTLSEIDRGISLNTCSNCGRILVSVSN